MSNRAWIKILNNYNIKSATCSTLLLSACTPNKQKNDEYQDQASCQGQKRVNDKQGEQKNNTVNHCYLFNPSRNHFSALNSDAEFSIEARITQKVMKEVIQTCPGHISLKVPNIVVVFWRQVFNVRFYLCGFMSKT